MLKVTFRVNSSSSENMSTFYRFAFLYSKLTDGILYFHFTYFLDKSNEVDKTA